MKRFFQITLYSLLIFSFHSKATQPDLIECYEKSSQEKPDLLVFKIERQAETYNVSWLNRETFQTAKDLNCHTPEGSKNFLLKCSGPSWNGDSRYTTSANISIENCSVNGGPEITSVGLGVGRVAKKDLNPPPALRGIGDYLNSLHSEGHRGCPRTTFGGPGYCLLK